MADSQKTEQPTQKRLKEAREQGRFPVSRELLAGVQFALFVWLLARNPAQWLETLESSMRELLSAAFTGPSTPGDFQALASTLAAPLVVPLFKAGLLLTVGSLVLHMASTQFGVAPTKLAPDLTRLNPISKITQLPKQNLSQLVQALIALPLFAYVIGQLVTKYSPEFHSLANTGIRAGAGRVGSALTDVLWDGAALLLALGLFDYYRQRSRWESELKMSRQDIQDEHKESEGNPQIKARIRRLMRERSRRRMMKDVETATAVIVNPTHFAVALRYEAGEMPAPRVVAKGKNYLAARIRERAIQHQVPIVENPPLARSLYDSAKVGQEIPAHLFRAVAEVLAYIYRIMNRRPGLKR